MENNQNLTEEEKVQIAIEMMHKEPLETVGHIALLKLAELGVKTNSTNTEMTTEATFGGVRYSIKMSVTWEQKESV